MAEVDEGGNPLPEGGAVEASEPSAESASPSAATPAASRASAPRRVVHSHRPAPARTASAPAASSASVRSIDNALEKRESRLTETAPVQKFEGNLTARIDQLNGDKALSAGDRQFVKDISSAHFLAKAMDAAGTKPYSEAFKETSRDALSNAKSGRAGLTFNVDDLNVTSLDGPQQRAGAPSRSEIKVGGMPRESRLTETDPIKFYEKTLTERLDRENGDKPLSAADRRAIKDMTSAFSIAAGQTMTQSGAQMTLSDNFNDASRNVVTHLKEDLKVGLRSGMTVSPEDLRMEARIAAEQVKQTFPKMI